MKVKMITPYDTTIFVDKNMVPKLKSLGYREASDIKKRPRTNKKQSGESETEKASQSQNKK